MLHNVGSAVGLAFINIATSFSHRDNYTRYKFDWTEVSYKTRNNSHKTLLLNLIPIKFNPP